MHVETWDNNKNISGIDRATILNCEKGSLRECGKRSKHGIESGLMVKSKKKSGLDARWFLVWCGTGYPHQPSQSAEFQGEFSANVKM